MTMKIVRNDNVWSVADAKAHLSEVITNARETGQAQRIENRGRPVAVLVDASRFEAMSAIGEPVARYQAFLAQSASLRAAGGASLKLPRRRSRTVTPLGG